MLLQWHVIDKSCKKTIAGWWNEREKLIAPGCELFLAKKQQVW
jgi:hypothetical protein